MSTPAAGSSGAPPTRAKAAAVALSDYDHPKLIERFAPVAECIRRKGEEALGFPVADVTPRSLASLTAHLRLFTETALGRNSDKAARPMTKIPHKLFLDYSAGGALEVMLCTCLRFKESSGLRRLDLQNADKRSFYLDLVKLVEKNLVRAKLLPRFAVYLSPAIPSSVREKLEGIIKVRADHVTTVDAASHIVYADPPGTTPAETDGTDYCRTIELAPPLALVHWWYHPDSYDSWIPVADVQGDPEAEDDSIGPLHVHIRWLEDTHEFNEWMNELDYDVAEDLRDTVPAGSGASIPAASSSKKKKSSAVASAQTPRAGGNADKDGDGDGDDPKKSSKKRKRTEAGTVEREGARRSSAEGEALSTADGERRRDKKAEDSGGGERVRDRDRDRKRDRERDRDRDRDRDREGERERGRERKEKNRDRDADRDRVRDRDRDRERGKHRDRDRERELKRNRDQGDGPVATDGEGERGDGSRRRRRETSSDAEKSGPGARDSAGEGGQTSKRAKTSHEDGSGKSLKLRINVSKRSGDGNEESAASPEPSEGGDVGQPAFKVRVKVPLSSPSASGGAKTEVDEEGGQGGDGGDGGNKNSGKAFAQGKAPEASPDAGDKNSRHGKTKKKKHHRGSSSRNIGVAYTHNAEPIAESDIKRIRNISMDTKSSGGEASSGEGSRPGDDDEGTGDSDKMDVDENPEYRTTAVAEKGLDGKKAGAPVTAADLIESLPQTTVRIPSQSRWFRLDAIHDVEKRSLPEFFSNRFASKTPSVYKTYRDFMIDTWRQSPKTYLTATSIRRHLAGDVCAVLRVHAFLEHWGLINFGVQPETRPHHSVLKGIRRDTWNAAPVVEQASHSGPGGTPGGPTGIPRLLLFDEFPPSRRHVPPTSLNAVVEAAPKQKTDVPLATRREVYAAAAALKYECDACGEDCSRMRYHCVGQMDINLCPTCFANGQYPPTLSSRDFEQLATVGSSDAYDGSVWSEAEVLLLLEGLEQFGDDWTAVAGHVKTKTNEQCVMQFLRMPIEDSFLGDQLGKWGRGSGMKGASAKLASGEHIFAGAPLPFADASNPVMAQIAFLASSVSPEVAAAAAQAALTKIMQETEASPAAPGPVAGVTPERTVLAKKLMNRDVRPAADGGSSLSNGGAHVPNGVPGVPGTGIVNGQVAAPQQQAQRPPAGPSAPSTRGPGPIPGTELDSAAVQASSAVALAAAAARARKLADAEVRELDRVFAVVVETKLRVIEEKMKGFSQLEEMTRAERDRLESQRRAIYKDRVNAAIARTGGLGEVALDPAGSGAGEVPLVAPNAPVETIPPPLAQSLPAAVPPPQSQV